MVSARGAAGDVRAGDGRVREADSGDIVFGGEGLRSTTEIVFSESFKQLSYGLKLDRITATGEDPFDDEEGDDFSRALDTLSGRQRVPLEAIVLEESVPI